MDEEDEEEDYSYDAPDGGWGWVVVLGSFMVNCIADGVTFSFGILFIELQEEFQLSKALTAWVVSIFHAVPLLSGPLASTFCDRYGCRIATVIGSLLATFGFLLSSLGTSLAYLYITFGLIAGFGLSLCYVAAIVIVTIYFDDKRSLATGISVCGSGVGTFIFAPLTQFLVTEYRWRGASILLGGCCLQMVVCGLLFKDLHWSTSRSQRVTNGSLPRRHLPTFLSSEDIKSSEEVITALRSKNYKLQIIKSPQDIEEMNQPIRHLCSRTHLKRKMSSFLGRIMSKCQVSHTIVRYRVRASSCPDLLGIQSNSNASLHEIKDTRKEPKNGETIYLANGTGILSYFQNCSFMNFQFIFFCLSNLILYMWFDVMYIYLMDYAEKDLGFSPKRATLLISVIGIFNMLGGFIIGWCGDKDWINMNWLYASCMLICGIANAFVPFLTQYWALAFMAGLYGFSIAANYSLTSPILVEIVSLNQFSTAYGYVLLAQGMSNLIGPPLAGYLYDETKEWFYTFGLSGLFIALSGTLLLVIPFINFLKNLKSKHCDSPVENLRDSEEEEPLNTIVTFHSETPEKNNGIGI
ncbi:Monocarboxylate transporter 12,Monocarboxylate transporter 12-B [Lepeophtheirus salmonis]|uniref:Monocarboxylate transporter 12,Monocarboxylate transporter 12-B n=1 Tax=Lepeophtheirus salmonis TaxID=72036 RepID=A0A7R8CYT0_LEPSM|nr:Monocarboxylate transporter 12,Monocarboxylate transporter 12-B [Lepeophtheirus salmonis]CAF2944093.1 Monocarboxylate transporter 12,Monocarboxylate transporter 12-B [Lepeophtheirus salmonis]